jgi:hypothetical protein
MRILEIGEAPFMGNHAPGLTDFFSVHKDAKPEARLTLRRIYELRRQLRAGHYDLVVYHLQAKVVAPWHRHGLGIRSALEATSWSLSAFYKMAWHHFHSVLAGIDTPLVIVDVQDTPRITKTESYWLDRARFWFMRELPPNHFNLFLSMDRRCGDVINIQRQPLVARNLAKIRPFSLGFDVRDTAGIEAVPPEGKIHDIFYAGANHTTTVRQEGLKELKALQAAGVRVHLPEKRMPQAEFFRTCARSWLIWSPEGQGWDCHRHYEALMVGSVPVINQPTIERRQPFIHGEHCLYYRTEPGGLTEAVTRALADRAALGRISAQGRAHVRQHHTQNQLARHVLASVGLLEKAADGVVDL